MERRYTPTRHTVAGAAARVPGILVKILLELGFFTELVAQHIFRPDQVARRFGVLLELGELIKIGLCMLALRRSPATSLVGPQRDSDLGGGVAVPTGDQGSDIGVLAGLPLADAEPDQSLTGPAQPAIVPATKS